MKQTNILVFAIAAFLATPVYAQDKNLRMYKCVDTDGKVYYSDKMNPDCAKATEMNRHGITVTKKEVSNSAQPVKTNVPTKSSLELERRDKALLASYTSEQEIDAARDRSLAIPMQGVKTVEAKLEKTTAQLTELKKQADTLASQQKKLPARLLEEVSTSQKELAALEADLTQRKAQADVIRLKFEADKKRFRELKDPGQANQ
jgi:hypothetical protein